MSLRFCAALSLLLATVLLSACSTTGSVKKEESELIRLYQAKSEHLGGFKAWNMEGRLAVSDESDGGSGRFRWNRNAADVQMDFHGALGRGAWKLRAGGQGAELTLADGTTHQADSIEELVRQQVGWEIPVDNLSWWVRGLGTPDGFENREFDGEGNISLLVQDGWTIEYDKYRIFSGISLPVKLTAHRGKWKVKLVIRSWDLTETAGENG